MCGRFKGMIKPNMGMGFSDSRKISARKSFAFVMYLRARRGVADYTMPDRLRDYELRTKVRMRKDHLRTLDHTPPPATLSE